MSTEDGNREGRQALGLPLSRLTAIILFAAIAPSVLLMAPAIAGQLMKQWAFSTSQVGQLFSAELAAMSLASLPAFWWQSRLDWRRVGIAAALVFVAANLASVAADGYGWLLAWRTISALGGGTLMVLCMACAAVSPQRDRVYGLWVAGQLVLGALGLWVLPALFARFGLSALYIGQGLLMLLCLPLARAFPKRLLSSSQRRSAAWSPAALWAAGLGIVAVLLFYVGLSGVWTFMGTVAERAGMAAHSAGTVLALASLMGIAGSVTATVIGPRWPRRRLLIAGYFAMAASVLLLLDHPGTARYATAALVFKFTWTFVLPYLLATLADQDHEGRLMSMVNLTIGGGLALGPALAGPLMENANGLTAMLTLSAACLVVSLLLVLLTAPKAHIALGAGLDRH